MTNELEKQFFSTFGIEPRLDCKKCGAKNFALGQCWEVNCEKSYPQITDRIYLELHCLLNSLDTPPYGLTVKEFKKDILISAIGVLSRNESANRIDNIKHQVRTLFEEG